jgi:hypothetical protein
MTEAESFPVDYQLFKETKIGKVIKLISKMTLEKDEYSIVSRALTLLNQWRSILEESATLDNGLETQNNKNDDDENNNNNNDKNGHSDHPNDDSKEQDPEPDQDSAHETDSQNDSTQQGTMDAQEAKESFSPPPLTHPTAEVTEMAVSEFIQDIMADSVHACLQEKTTEASAKLASYDSKMDVANTADSVA